MLHWDGVRLSDVAVPPLSHPAILRFALAGCGEELRRGFSLWAWSHRVYRLRRSME